MPRGRTELGLRLCQLDFASCLALTGTFSRVYSEVMCARVCYMYYLAYLGQVIVHTLLFKYYTP